MKIVKVKNDKNYKKISIIVGIVIIMFLIGISSITTLESRKIGLKVRFGKLVDTNLKEGLNLKTPFIENMVAVNVRVQKIEKETTSASKDMQDVKTTIVVNYKINEQEAVNHYKTMDEDYEKIILGPALEESIKSIISKYNAEELIPKRKEVSILALKTLQEKMENMVSL